MVLVGFRSHEVLCSNLRMMGCVCEPVIPRATIPAALLLDRLLSHSNEVYYYKYLNSIIYSKNQKHVLTIKILCSHIFLLLLLSFLDNSFEKFSLPILVFGFFFNLLFIIYYDMWANINGCGWLCNLYVTLI